MGALVRVAFGVTIVGIAGGGCRQLFGISDTDVAADAPISIDGRIDALPAETCIGQHELCLNFDSDEHGIQLLSTVETLGSADSSEKSDPTAPSAPNVMRAVATEETTSAESFRGRPFLGGELKSSVITFKLRVGSAGPSAPCDPMVFVIGWSTDMMTTTHTISLAVSDRLDVSVMTPFQPGGASLPFGRDQWVPIAVAFSLETGDIRVDAGTDTEPIVAPGLSDAKDGIALVALGLTVVGNHGTCTVDIDDVVLDFTMP